MAETEAPLRPRNAAGNNGQNEEQPWYNQIGGQLFRMIFIYYLINFVKDRFITPQAPAIIENVNSDTNTNKETGNNGQQKVKTTIPKPFKPIWSFNTKVSLKVYLSEEDSKDDFSSKKLFWESNPVVFGNSTFSENINGFVDLSPTVQNNGTLYAHVYMIKEGASFDPESENFDKYGFVHKKHLLTRFVPLRKEVKRKKLIGSAGEDQADTPKDGEPQPEPQVGGSAFNKILRKKVQPTFSHWHDNFTISLVNHDGTFDIRALPPTVPKHFSFSPRKEHDEEKPYADMFPVMYFNDFWILREKLYPINSTTTRVPLNIQFEPITLWKFQLLVITDTQLKSQLEMMGGDTSELDLIKSTLMDTSPWLLALTMIVSLLHTLFDFLAFKNDIAFWKGKKDGVGISVRTMIMNVIFSVIIFLYLLDNNENTSWMVLLSNGVGVAIEAWKVKKALNAQFVRQENGFLPYKLLIVPKVTTELEDKTEEYDTLAYTYLGYVAYPLLICYSVYSVFYEEHKSWYSFVINTAVGFVYTFGFITMTPQLFINYKLKSVAHMPWKTFMYKALNTFVDDLFSFIVKMPWLHRLACLRDDVVFFVYLYQRWIYKEDKTRMNEFGQVGEIEKEKVDESKPEAKKEK